MTAPASAAGPRTAPPVGGPGSAADGDAPIRTEGLTKVYGTRTAVRELDLEVRAGEIFGLLGQNGAGKTTTILMLLGLTEPTRGRATVVGLDPARHPLEVKRRVGYMPDAVGFYGSLTGRENLRYTARLNGLGGREAEARIDAVLELVTLADRADSPTSTYSRGMLQRLGIADALVKEPDVLILDEPTAAIDPIGVGEMLTLLASLAHEQGITILLSSHLLNQVQSICDRVGIFAAGRLIGTGTVDELAAQFGFATNDVEVEVDVAPDRVADIEARLRTVPGIVAVQPAEDAPAPTWHLTPDPARAGAAPLREVANALPDGVLVGVGRRHVALDAIYRRAVALDAEAAAGEVPA